ncbi:ATP:cob(I)alamin adenosyltransferase [Ideonella sp. A 288]|uniref:ATP:cob(I)alamin adenosyltransferase n=1 Tax=Ideonella sp. A 288 TaxID=1962181 RepID=UPI000B4A64CE|nr:ATP:cob(I)alamin adenosyltransferase [Ideonella sp. A 288]
MIRDPGALRALLDRAPDEHPARPREFAEALLAQAPVLGDDADSAEAIRLAEHVMLAHLADAEALARFISCLPHVARASARRAEWALARLAGQPEPDLPDALRWRALLNAVLAAARCGRHRDAADWLAADEARAAAHSDADARKAYAVTANNTALELRLGPRGDAAADALMLQAAALSRRAWAAAGTWLHVERAEYQWALCHAQLGQGEAALMHARQCLAMCLAEGADAAERFFAHEALARAWHAAGDVAQVAQQRLQMTELLAQVGDEAMRTWCAQTLEDLPAGPC